MTRHRYVRYVAMTAMMLLARHAAAQDHPTPSAAPARVEITPYVSLGSAQSTLFGTALAFPWTGSISVEGEVGYRSGEVDGPTADVSLVYSRPRQRRIAPYVAAGVGLREYGAALGALDGSLFTRSRTAAVVNAGGGLTVGVDSRWSFRTDARWYNGLGPDAPEHWRLFTGVTVRVLGSGNQGQ